MNIQQTVKDLELAARLIEAVGGKKGAEGILRGRLKVVEVVDYVPTEMKMRASSDPHFVCIDRTQKPQYPYVASGDLCYPEFEHVGPSEFDFRLVQYEYRMGETKDHEQEYWSWYASLEKRDLLKGSLGLADFQVIKAGGSHEINGLLGDKTIWGFKSAVRMGPKALLVPVMYVYNKRIRIRWRRLKLNWRSDREDCVTFFPSS